MILIIKLVASDTPTINSNINFGNQVIVCSHNLAGSKEIK
jgi:hypothetical protein